MAKRIKDPIYGYIEIPDSVQKIIDTPVFQRLRDIVQTSYTSLYPSATHNRFVHSIGVYHLGTLSLYGLGANLKSNEGKFDFESYFNVFKLACLLHDVGHAPFSHTGEQYYLKNSERTDLHIELVKLAKDENLEKEISKNGYKAAPHELVSAIVGVKIFDCYLEDKSSFFARCITGYKYTIDLDEEKSFQNSLIELLNSKVIDVDKLDYLIRDSYCTGFDTVKIDYHRLLSSLCLLSDSEYKIGFNKSAISVLENVVYAHDLERKWIQNHPSVIYEMYLMEQILDRIIKECFKEEYLDISLLLEKGKLIKEVGTIRLLSDSSIVYLLKNIKSDSFIDEYLNRSIRKKPLWKSESEFNAIFQGNDGEISILMDEFEKLEKYIKKLGFPFVINSNVEEKCNLEITELKKESNTAIDSRKSSLVAEREKYLKMIKMMLDLLDKDEREAGIVIRFTNQFVSGFSKKEFPEIKISFPKLKPCGFGTVTPILKPPSTINPQKLFYIFSPHGKDDVDMKKLYEKLLQFAQEIKNEESSKRFK